eukprot:g18268.t1
MDTMISNAVFFDYIRHGPPVDYARGNESVRGAPLLSLLRSDPEQERDQFQQREQAAIDFFAEVGRFVDGLTGYRYLFSLFGSRLHGCYGARSDVDICLLLHDHATEESAKLYFMEELATKLQKMEAEGRNRPTDPGRPKVTNVRPDSSVVGKCTLEFEWAGFEIDLTFVLWTRIKRDILEYEMNTWVPDCEDADEDVDDDDHLQDAADDGSSSSPTSLSSFTPSELDAQLQLSTSPSAGKMKKIRLRRNKGEGNEKGGTIQRHVNGNGDAQVFGAIAACLSWMGGYVDQLDEDAYRGAVAGLKYLQRVRAQKVECSAFVRGVVDADAIRALGAANVVAGAAARGGRGGDHRSCPAFPLRPMFAKIAYLIAVGNPACGTSSRFAALVASTQQQIHLARSRPGFSTPVNAGYPRNGIGFGPNLLRRSGKTMLVDLRAACAFVLEWARICGLKKRLTNNEARLKSIELVALFLCYVRGSIAGAVPQPPRRAHAVEEPAQPADQFRSTYQLVEGFLCWLRSFPFEKYVLRPFARAGGAVLALRPSGGAGFAKNRQMMSATVAAEVLVAVMRSQADAGVPGQLEHIQGLISVLQSGADELDAGAERRAGLAADAKEIAKACEDLERRTLFTPDGKNLIQEALAKEEAEVYEEMERLQKQMLEVEAEIAERKCGAANIIKSPPRGRAPPKKDATNVLPPACTNGVASHRPREDNSELERALADLRKMNEDPVLSKKIDEQANLFKDPAWLALPTQLLSEDSEDDDDSDGGSGDEDGGSCRPRRRDDGDGSSDSDSGAEEVGLGCEVEDRAASESIFNSTCTGSEKVCRASAPRPDDGAGESYRWARRACRWKDTPLALVWSNEMGDYGDEDACDYERYWSWAQRLSEVQTLRLHGAVGDHFLRRLREWAAYSVSTLQESPDLLSFYEKLLEHSGSVPRNLRTGPQAADNELAELKIRIERLVKKEKEEEDTRRARVAET